METIAKTGFMARIAMFAIGSLFVALGATTARADAWGKVYWTDTGNDNIRRANLDGSDVEVLVTGVNWPMGLALDLVGGKMYWTNGISVNKISRANLDGTGVEDLLTGMADPRGIALDVAAGKMYFSSEDNDLIRRANLDGTGIETILSNVPFCTHLDLDLTAGKIYWTDIQTGFGDGTISRANLDGTGRETLLTAPGAPGNWFYPVGIELDVAAGKMYWADSQEDLLCRANLDGSGLEEFSLRPPADPSPTDLALDPVAGKIYWTNMVDNQGVWRANMDSSLSDRESIVSTGMYYPSAIEVIPVLEPSGIDVTPLAHHPDLMLDPPTPNPVTVRTFFRFASRRAGRVTLDVYDVRGRSVARVASFAAADGVTRIAEWVPVGVPGSIPKLVEKPNGSSISTPPSPEWRPVPRSSIRAAMPPARRGDGAFPSRAGGAVRCR